MTAPIIFTIAAILATGTIVCMGRAYWEKARAALFAVHVNEIPLWDGPADPDPFYERTNHG